MMIFQKNIINDFPCKCEHIRANIYLLEFNNKNTRKRCEICSKVTIKTPKHVIDVALVFLLLTLNIFHAFF